MRKCKKAANMVANAGTDVSVSVNVTNIVKYVSLAGVAIVGIIFGTRSYVECIRSQKACSDKNV